MQRDSQRDRDEADAELDSRLDLDVGTGAQPSTSNPDGGADGAPATDTSDAIDSASEVVDLDSEAFADEIDPGSGLDTGTDGDAGARADARSGGRLRGLVPSPSLPSFSVPFSPKAFLAMTVLSVIGLVVGSSIPVLGGVPVLGRLLSFLGLFVVAFGAGLVGKKRRYLEVGAGAAVASAFSFVLGVVSRQLIRVIVGAIGSGSAVDAGTVGLVITGVGAGTGLLVALVGYYFGRDLREGLTRDLGDDDTGV